MQKNASVIIHVFGWTIVFSLTVLFLAENQHIATALFNPYLWLFFLIYIALFYLNTHWLIPKLYFRKKYLLYFGLIFLVLISIAAIQPFDKLVFERSHPQVFRPYKPPHPRKFGFPPPQHRNPPPNEADNSGNNRPEPRSKIDVISIFFFGLIWALGMALKITERWRETEQRAIQAEADKANAELSFLKAQINPHFLFNTLNNIYSLAVINSKHTADSIMKLSQIMRYVTDEVSEDFVPLTSEIECIGNYIDLQKLRLSKKTEVLFTVEGIADFKNIVPLSLMTFVENAFKHGISNHENSQISINIVLNEKYIKFYCKNTLFQASRKVERTGIGLANTQQRLKHLYKNRHILVIKEEDRLYQVELIIET
ncbi:sensor histidine kinase [Emticicia sp. 17c]|uniref:sensor histidine kinase n=1 Tax=Emticicia sp. 17c TaxID=3127704 RepID=UPI00301B8398